MLKLLSIIFFLLSVLNIHSQGLTLNYEAKMIVGEESNVTINGNLVLNNHIPLEIKNSSFIVKGESSGSGEITFTKTIPSNRWEFVSSPVLDQSVTTFVAEENLSRGLGSHTDNRGLTYFNNSEFKWVIYNGVDNVDFPNIFESGKGWGVHLEGNGENKDISFTGLFPGLDISKTNQNIEEAQHFFIGNPYPSSISVGDQTAEGVAFLSYNGDNLKEKTMWIWNSENRDYDIANNLVGTSYIRPGQSFFVKSISGSAVFSFKKDMQSHQSTTSYQQKNSSSSQKIKLMITDGSSHKHTVIYYVKEATNAFDNGFDSTTFNSGGTDIYTHLVEDSEGNDYRIQALPNNNHEKTIVSVGVNATSSSEITISAAIDNLPAEIKVYLEDKEKNSFNLLDNSATFKTTLSEDINGIGRFYLHTTSQVLSSDKVALNNNPSIYISSEENLRISGVHIGEAKIRMYDILGKQLINTSFEGNGMNDIVLPKNISDGGVYIVHLVTDTKIITKKIMI
jgi:hypothetical protein